MVDKRSSPKGRSMGKKVMTEAAPSSSPLKL
jgi:hypothetical protein